jgi:hypothetical protein
MPVPDLIRDRNDESDLRRHSANCDTVSDGRGNKLLDRLLNSANDVIPVLTCYGNKFPYTAKATAHLNNMMIFIEISF